MLQHVATLEIPQSQSVWIVYEGSLDRLDELESWVSSLNAQGVYIGSREMSPRISTWTRQGFGFRDRNLAMRFRLTW